MEYVLGGMLAGIFVREKIYCSRKKAMLECRKE